MFVLGPIILPIKNGRLLKSKIRLRALLSTTHQLPLLLQMDIDGLQRMILPHFSMILILCRHFIRLIRILRILHGLPVTRMLQRCHQMA